MKEPSGKTTGRVPPAPRSPDKLFLPLSAAVSLIVLALFLLLSLGGFLHRADLFCYDLFFKWRGRTPASSRTLLVLMDDASARELSKPKGPWPRSHIAAALHNLCAAGATVVGLDMVLTAASRGSAEDMLLAQAIERCGNTVLARIITAQGTEHIQPLPLFQEKMLGDGFIDLPLDEDDILRRVRYLSARPLADGALELVPSFSLELARSFANIDFLPDLSNPETFIVGPPSGPSLRLPFPDLLVDFHGDYRSFAHISFADAMKGRFAPALVRGRLVIVGSASAMDKDWFSTPFSRFYNPVERFRGRFAVLVDQVQRSKDLGVAAHAYAAETILSGRFIRKLSWTAVVASLVATTVMGLFFYLPGVSLPGQTILFAVVLAAMQTGSYLLFRHRLLWLEMAGAYGIFCLQYISGNVVQRVILKKKEAQLTNLFGRYVAPQVVRELLSMDLTEMKQGKNLEVTVLFTDIRGFTSMAENLGAARTGQLLNTYFDVMIPAIFRNGGTLDKLIGDAIMAFYGAPAPQEDQTRRAADTALEMIDALLALRLRQPDKAQNLDMGIGIARGEAIVGNLGSTQFMNYTVIGDTVNLSSRLEGLTRIYDVRIIVSAAAAAALGDGYLLRELDLVRVKGKNELVPIYELVGTRQEVAAELTQRCALFARALAAYRGRDFPLALELFGRCLDKKTDDRPAALYIERCRRFLDEPPPPAWQGETVFTQK